MPDDLTAPSTKQVESTVPESPGESMQFTTEYSTEETYPEETVPDTTASQTEAPTTESTLPDETTQEVTTPEETKQETTQQEPTEETISPETPEETQQETSAEPTQEETVPKPMYTFTEFEQIMYVTEGVNVRTLPCVDGDKRYTFGVNHEVHVTGQCNKTGWYRILYKGEVLYISNGFLSDTQVQTPAPVTDWLQYVLNDTKPLGNKGRLYIPEVGINVALNKSYVGKPSSHTYVDMEDSAAWLDYGVHTIIGDHYYQGFNGIKRCIPKQTVAYIKTEEGITKYICYKVDRSGRNLRSVLEDSKSNDVSQYQQSGFTCYTCNNPWATSVTLTTFIPAKE